jgi:hypothetical protein
MRYRARGLYRMGPYFRRFSASAGKRRSQRRGGPPRAGWTSQGFMFGNLTVNTTSRTYTYDTPGPGAVEEDMPEWSVRLLDSTPLTRWLLAQP